MTTILYTAKGPYIKDILSDYPHVTCLTDTFVNRSTDAEKREWCKKNFKPYNYRIVSYRAVYDHERKEWMQRNFNAFVHVFIGFLRDKDYAEFLLRWS